MCTYLLDCLVEVELFRDMDAVVRYLMAPWPMKNRLAARKVTQYVKRVLAKSKIIGLEANLPSNMRAWHRYALNKCQEILHLEQEVKDKGAGAFISLVTTASFLLILAVAALCAGLLNKSWKAFPLGQLELLPERCPALQDCMGMLLEARDSLVESEADESALVSVQ